MDFSIVEDKASSRTKDYIKFINAEEGTEHDVPSIDILAISGLKNASAIFEYIERNFNVKKSDQYVLRQPDGKALDPYYNLDEYLGDQRVLFFFDKKVLSKQEPKGEFEELGEPELSRTESKTFFPDVYDNELPRDAKLIVDADTGRNFENLLALFRNSQDDLQKCIDCLTRTKNQKQAQELAKNNLVNYYEEKKTKTIEILEKKKKSLQRIKQLVKDFDQNVKKLRNTPIHDALQTQTTKNLADLFDLKEAANAKDKYDKNNVQISQLVQKVEDFIIQRIDDARKIQGNISSENQASRASTVRKSEIEFTDAHDQYMNLFKSLLDKSKGKPAKADLIQFMQQGFETVEPKIKAAAQPLSDIKKGLESDVKENTKKLCEFIAEVNSLQSDIKNRLISEIETLSNVLDKHNSGVKNLEMISNFPSVYENCLEEIRRRNKFKKDFESLVEFMETITVEENRKRAEFAEQYEGLTPQRFGHFLFVNFPSLNYKLIKETVQKDTPVSLELLQKSSMYNQGAHTDILQILTNTNNEIQNKDKKINQLEVKISEQNSAIAKLQDHIDEKGLTATNLKMVIGENGFNEKFNFMADQLKVKFETKIKELNKRIFDLKRLVNEKVIIGVKTNILKMKEMQAQNQKKEDQPAPKNQVPIEQVEQYQMKVAQLASENESLQKLIDDILEKNQRYELEINKLKKDNQDLVNKLEKITALNQKNSTVMQTKLGRLDQLEKQVKQSDEKCAQLLNQIETLKQNHRNELQNVKNQSLKENDQRIQMINEDFKKLLKNKEEADKEVLRLTEHMNKKQDETNKLQKHLQEVKAEFNAVLSNGQIDKETETALDQLYEQVSGNKPGQKPLATMVGEISKTFISTYAKLKEFNIGEIVVGIRIPGMPQTYQIISNGFYGDSKIFYYTKSQKESGPIVTCKIKGLEPAQDNKLLSTYPNYDFILAQCDIIDTISVIEK